MNPLFPLQINSSIFVAEDEVEIAAIRAQGAGGQNVNKVSSAVHLRFDITSSSLPEYVKEKLLSLNDRRISSDGVLVIKAQRFRTREKNIGDAIERLQEVILQGCVQQKARRPTKPSKSARMKRVDSKVKVGQKKSLRGKVKVD